MSAQTRIFEGNVWIFGDNVDTDNIFPTRFGADPTPQVMATHVFIDARPEFNQNAKEGDIIVAGHNFGYGSYRETAVTGLYARGIKVVVARSFARAYYRNAINLGMTPMTLGDTETDFQENDIIRVNAESGELLNVRTGKHISCEVPVGLAADIIKAGGATEYFKPFVLHPLKK